MANKKISELTPKASTLEDTDLLMISDYNGATYDTKYVTGANVRPYKVYLAVINQSGTGAPSSSWNYDEFSTTLTWARTAVGSYTLTSSGTEFANLKTYVQITTGNSVLGWIGVVRTSTSVLTFKTYDGTQTLADSVLSSAQLEIKIIK
jgi:hypothetical protein